MAIGYGTVLLSDIAIFTVALKLLLLLAALMVGAVYVSVINDITDMEEDLASGKVNRMAKIPAGSRWIFPLLCILAGMLFTCFFWEDKLTVLLYLMAWISFTLYSIPPIRLKKRAGWGLLADACGAHFFTGLFIVSGISYFTGQHMDWLWFGSVGMWSLTYGLRGILWHQFSDRVNDLNSGVNTFATLTDPAKIRSAALILILVELFAFAVMLSHFHVLVWVFLLIYLLLIMERRRKFRAKIIVVISPEHHPYQILMAEYYQVFFPMVLLIIGGLVHPLTWIILIIHLMLFPRNISLIIKNMAELIRQELMWKRK